MEITVYGTGTAGTQMVKSTLEDYLSRAEVDFEIDEVNDVNEFLKMMIHSVPAVIIDGSEKIELKQNGKFNASLRQLVQSILKKESYGSLPKVIVPTDFSETSVNAFNYACQFTKSIGGVIKVVHVYYPSSADINGNVFVDVGLKKVKEALLDEFVEAANQDWIGELMSTVLIDKEFAEGFPVPKIIDIANQDKASYIIAGTTGEGESFKKWFGSISTELVKKADTPIIVVPPGARFTGFKNVVYASGDPLLDEKCMDNLCAFAQMHDATLHIVHVAQPNEEKTGNAIDWMEDNCSNVIVHHEEILHDDIVEGIQSYAQQHNADLIILSSKKEIFLRIFFIEVSASNLLCTLTHQ